MKANCIKRNLTLDKYGLNVQVLPYHHKIVAKGNVVCFVFQECSSECFSAG